MRVLVCGGRDYKDYATVCRILEDLHKNTPITLLIHGSATGADQLASRWAAVYGVPRKPFPANWLKHGKAAGPIRNRQMLEEGKPDLVMAFPGGRGTADMVRQATAAGVKVEVVQ